MLLSKRAEMFLPEKWPAYFSKAKGCRVWDLDGRELIDMSIMGIGTNTLGYGHPEIDEAVMKNNSKWKYVFLKLSRRSILGRKIS
jgi:glutamate-1-semialdehyde 2,1-aminomutase